MPRDSLKIMKDKGLFELVEKAWVHLPLKGDDGEYILKAHLIIEEIMVLLLVQATKNAKAIENAKLSFAQKVHLLQALYDQELSSWLYVSLKRLNTLRNKCAHILIPPNIEELIVKFVDSAYDFSSEVELSNIERISQLERSLSGGNDDHVKFMIKSQDYHHTITDRLPIAVERVLCEMLNAASTHAP